MTDVKNFRFIQICLIILFSVFLLNASQSLIRVSAEVDKSVITIGERIIYSLAVQHNKNLHVQQPGPGANLGQFEIKDYRIDEPVEDGNVVTQKFEYEISVFDTGRFVIPPFPVAFASSDTGRDFQIIKSEPIHITVKSVLTSEDAEIQDIKDPQNIPFNYRKWLLLGTAAVLIIAAILLTIYIIRRRKQGKPLFRKEEIRPAHLIALEELDLAKAQWEDTLARGEHKLLFTQISQILRKYLENRFFIPALEETSYEIQLSMAELSIGAEQQEKGAHILELSDRVKFATYLPQSEETWEIIQLMEVFIEETKLEFEAVEKNAEVEADNEQAIEPVPDRYESKEVETLPEKTRT